LLCGDKIDKNERGGACSAYGVEESGIQDFGGKPEGKGYLEDQSLDGSVILRGIFR
jgi:hypothetical protein